MNQSTAPMIRVRIVDAKADSVQQCQVSLLGGSTVRDALLHAQFAKPLLEMIEGSAGDSALHASESWVGIWGKRVLLSAPLTDGDRIELYRPIIADAKSARLARASDQGYRGGRVRRGAR
jgi:uncharacterized protein